MIPVSFVHVVAHVFVAAQTIAFGEATVLVDLKATTIAAILGDIARHDDAPDVADITPVGTSCIVPGKVLGKAVDRSNLDVVFVGGTATFLRITEGDKRDVGFALGHAKISDGLGLVLAAALGTIALGFTSDGKGEAGDTKGLDGVLHFIHL